MLLRKAKNKPRYCGENVMKTFVGIYAVTAIFLRSYRWPLTQPGHVLHVNIISCWLHEPCMQMLRLKVRPVGG